MSAVHSLPLRLIHWVTVGLVVAQVTLAALNAALYEPRPVLAEWLVQGHISLGAVVFVLTAVRLAVRVGAPAPAPVGSIGRRVAAGSLQGVLYACLFALPASGYVKLAALGFEIRLFGAVPLPALPLDVPLASAAARFHSWVAAVLATALIGHVAAALLDRSRRGGLVSRRIALRRG